MLNTHTSAWLLPDYVADLLPTQARQIEQFRRSLMDTARCYGYEWVVPPLVEHLESLLSGTGESLQMQTFQLVDQMSGRTLGVRADSTPQVARIDAHLLNRKGITRLCYCGPVLHTRPAYAGAGREPLQFGAEIYGHADLEADHEILLLAYDGLTRLGIKTLHFDLADVRIVDAVLRHSDLSAEHIHRIHRALSRKDIVDLHALSQNLNKTIQDDLVALIDLYGDSSVLNRAKTLHAAHDEHLQQALYQLEQMGQRLQDWAGVQVRYDLADLRGYDYYTGLRFTILAPHSTTLANGFVEVARGGRYDAVGAVFGRNRPAVGFGLDVKSLLDVLPVASPEPAIYAPWGDDPHLRQTILALRKQGETVICHQPSDVPYETDDFQCDRQLCQQPSPHPPHLPEWQVVTRLP